MLNYDQGINDREHYIDDVTDALIYKCFELNCELPGSSQLKVVYCIIQQCVEYVQHADR